MGTASREGRPVWDKRKRTAFGAPSWNRLGGAGAGRAKQSSLRGQGSPGEGGVVGAQRKDSVRKEGMMAALS